jgi:hypothetical protein
MERIILDAENAAKLKRTPVAVCDESGNILGHVLTDAAFERVAAQLLPCPTAAEIAEARREMLAAGGVTMDELLARFDRTEREWKARQ